jgi:hypothetical protein
MRAVVAVELALVSLPMILALLAAVELGRAVYLYNALAKASRDAARHLSAFDPRQASDYRLAIEQARTRAVFGAGTVPIAPGLSASMVRICDRSRDEGCVPGSFGTREITPVAIDLVRVEIVGYPFTPIAPGAGLLGPIRFGPIGTSMRQFL